MSSLPTTNAAPGTCFKFTVRSADEAARVIREKLGEQARVLSVRNVERSGVLGLFASPRLEVIAQLAAAETPAPIAEKTALAVRETAPSARARVRTPRSSLPDLLRRSGYSEKLLMRLFESPAWVSLNELPLHRALVETGRHLGEIAARARPERAALTRAAFIGTPGVGRTTALCKWLSVEVFRRARLGHVVTAEFDRPVNTGSLPVFCEALGVPLAHFPASTEVATPGGFVYFDLPGLSLRQPSENTPIVRFLDQERIRDRVLVLNAAYDHAALRDTYAAGRDLGATHVVFTHLDEVSQWGRLWDYLLDGELEPLFLSTGPSLAGDIEANVSDAVVRRTLPPTADTALEQETEEEDYSSEQPEEDDQPEEAAVTAVPRPAFRHQIFNTAA